MLINSPRNILILLFFLVVSSLILLVIILNYRNNKIDRLSNCPINIFIPKIKLKESSKLVVVLIGDSRISQWPDDIFPEDISVINLGVSGATTFETLCLLDNVKVLPDADWYIIQLGINDATAISMMSGQQKQRELNRTSNNLKEIINFLKNSDSRIILTTVVPPIKLDFIRRLLWGNEIDEFVESLSVTLSDESGERVYLLDMRDIFYDFSNMRWRTEFAKDSLHWNRQGYEALFEGIQRLMSKVNVVSPNN